VWVLCVVNVLLNCEGVGCVGVCVCVYSVQCVCVQCECTMCVYVGACVRVCVQCVCVRVCVGGCVRACVCDVQYVAPICRAGQNAATYCRRKIPLLHQMSFKRYSILSCYFTLYCKREPLHY